MNPEIALRSLQAMGMELVASIPRIGGGIVIVLLSLVVARGIRWLVMRATLGRFGHENLRLAVGRLAFVFTVAIGMLFAATVVFPSFSVGNLISLLGVSGVVVGFAFKDIFQNFLAGILILVTNPFAIDDQIAVDAYEGTVVEIQTRATIIRTYDHRQVVVPNADLFTKSVIVNTAYEKLRMRYDLAVNATSDLDAVKRVIADALHSGIEGVAKDPTADVLVLALAGDKITLRVLWWASSRRGEYLVVQDRVLTALRRSLQAANIGIA